MITGKTRVVGIIGDPVEHSFSPPMHNQAFQYMNLDYVYVPFWVKKESLPHVILAAKTMNIKGLNVTIPHKTAIINYLDEIEKTAKFIGAVNTLEFSGGKFRGYNTDGIGAIRAIEEKTPIKNKKILIMGAGGAARAISFQLMMSGASELVIANRTMSNALSLREDLINKLDVPVKCVDLEDGLQKEVATADILINTTSRGMYPHHNQKSLLDHEHISPHLVVMDIVYNPLETALLKEAKMAGAEIISGIRMLIYQGMESFKIWTGLYPPFEVFEKALLKVMKK